MHFNVGILLANVVLVLLCSERICATIASTWDSCGCYWGEWDPWSKCTARCYGRQYRKRSVWHHNTDECDTYQTCATFEAGTERRTCNKVCYNDGVYSPGVPCGCRPGWRGRCCDRVVTCGFPASITHGQVHGSSYNYGNTVTYSCNTYYNMTGYYKQMCQDNGIWSGTKPRCIFVNTCDSNPCQNSGTCVDGLDEYTCRCRPGYSGVHCEHDIQPPVFTNCPRSFTAHATAPTLNVTWVVPRASDPLGHEVTVITNYPDGYAQLPWDDFTVQYVATKAFNGLQSECKFVISIRPTSCPELNVPENGAKVCNGWKTDMANLCLVFCSGDKSLPFGFDHRQWWVCGARGAWIPAAPLPNCSVHPQYEGIVAATSYNTGEYHFVDCAADDVRMKTMYVEAMMRSEFSSFCENVSDCQVDNVAVLCSN
ncbi:sushi, von Willebrand factor type A, EGF and pentraxin domain-containing protein 1-like [Gigantopelta aegis]|uniref:sushi, von Willebrand factor type A, EGF and pentraxin domain-containing protein 1-like n=1 Tax=Gigantopelta aegis TaxID=1735272 RepID=UPI001B88B268|nr:sushi, von Willebrand factor type A, EGF and pentraxin domain-containing protein 1-like [Gigantopelta aegis]